MMCRTPAIQIHKQPRFAASRTAFTLVELLMALTITALIGAAVAAMLSAVTYGTDSSHDLRTLVVKSETIAARLSAAVRESAQLLDAGDGYVVLWTSDLNDSGQPDLLELRRIEWDSDTDELTDYTPDPAATDVAYDLSTDDFDAISNNLIVAGDMVGELWATNVTDWQVGLDSADPQDAALLSFRITVNADGMSDTSIQAVSMRE